MAKHFWSDWFRRDRYGRKFWTPELGLLVAMLAVLTALIYFVLNIPTETLVSLNLTGNSTLAGADVLEFRKTILTVIITAFGAWVGAGAAYFFGRENLKIASQSLLEMRKPSAEEILRQTRIGDMSPKPIRLTAKLDDEIGTVINKLSEDPELWFFAVTEDKNKHTILSEDAIWIYLNECLRKKPEKQDYDEIIKKKIKDLLDYLKNNLDKKRLDALMKIYVPTSLDKSALETYNQIQDQGLNIAIIIDLKSDKPTHYITIGDIKDYLMKQLTFI